MSNPMTRKVKALSDSTLHKLHNRQDCMCIYCGEYIDIREPRGIAWSVEHIVPRTVYKWIERTAPKSVVENCFRDIESLSNLAITHHHCNYACGCSLPTAESIKNNNYIPEPLKTEYLNSLQRLKPYVDKYLVILDYLLKKQKSKCGRCGCLLRIDQAVLRRRNVNKIRNIRNAIVLCPECSSQRISSKYGTPRIQHRLKSK